MTSSYGMAIQYDPTCSAIRMREEGALTNNRVFYFSPVTRAGQTLWQLGLEIFDCELPYGEAETIMSLLAVLESVGIRDYRVSLAPPGYEGIMVGPENLDRAWRESLNPLICLLGERAIIGGVFPPGMAYYRKVRFLIYVKGMGKPAGGGGRYDGTTKGLVGTGGYLDLEAIGRFICSR